MPKRKQKKYSKPHKSYDKARIEEENVLKEKYGLKNKREIWKADAAIARIRNQAKQLITAGNEEKKSFIKKLHKKGFEIEKIADVLGLDKQDWLKRRLQTIVHKKKLANTPKQARQLIVHKHVSVSDGIVNIPSYQVDLDEEPKVRLNLSLKVKEKEKSKLEEIKDEVLETLKSKEGNKKRGEEE